MTDDKDALLRAATTVKEMLELGDGRLMAQDGPCGGQLPQLSPDEWGKVYRACKRIIKHRARITAALAGGKDGGCEWVDEGDYWDTACGESHCLSSGTPQENGMKFCCYCGDKIPPLPKGE